MIWSKNGSSNLASENLRLRRKVAALEAKAKSPISVSPEKGEVKIDNFRVGPLVIDKLDLKSQALSESAHEVDKFATLETKGLQLPELQALAKKPLFIRDLKAQIPLPFVNSALEQIAGAQLKKAGLSELQLGQTQDGQLKIRGRLQKGVNLPFEVTGKLASTKDGKVSFQIAKSKVGSIPMPNLLVSLATRLAGEHLDKAGVSVKDNTFSIDPKRHKPENVSFQLQELSLHNGALLVEGGMPVVSGRSPIPKIPRKK